MNAAIGTQVDFGAVFDVVSTSATVQDAVVALRDAYGLDHATYHHAQIFGQTMDAPYVRSTYPAEWLARYLLRGYIRVDPVVREGFARQLPFDWRELTLTPSARDLMIDAAAHGLAGNGYSIPLIDKQLRRALFSITANVPGPQWDEFIRGNAVDLAELANRIHAMAVQDIYTHSESVPKLNPRELECLTWAAQGKEYKQIATIIGVSDNTAREYLKTARIRLGCGTIAQAVAKAIGLGLIRP